MSPAVQQILESFDHLPRQEKQELASEILRRSTSYNLPPLSDEDLVLNAEAVFLELDQREAAGAKV